MKLFYCDEFTLPLPADHRFPPGKYRLLRRRIEAERVVPPRDMFVPRPVSVRELETVHDPGYVRRVFDAPRLR